MNEWTNITARLSFILPTAFNSGEGKRISDRTHLTCCASKSRVSHNEYYLPSSSSSSSFHLHPVHLFNLLFFYLSVVIQSSPLLLTSSIWSFCSLITINIIITIFPIITTWTDLLIVSNLVLVIDVLDEEAKKTGGMEIRNGIKEDVEEMCCSLWDE